jgi:hypothetical protein
VTVDLRTSGGVGPELVAPVVAWLAHGSCSLTGEKLSAGGGHVARVFVGLTRGWGDRDLTVEAVADHIDEVGATDGFWMPRSGVEQVLALLDGLGSEAALPGGTAGGA